MSKDSTLVSFVDLTHSVDSEIVELSCLGPSIEDGGARSGLGLSDTTLWTALKASRRRRRTVLF